MFFCALLLISAGGCSSLPNTGLLGDTFAAVGGKTTNGDKPVIDDAAGVQELNPAAVGVLRIIRPSKSEQGVEGSAWQAGVIVLIPAAAVAAEHRGGLAKDVAVALTSCAPDLGSFADIDTWRRAEVKLSAGKVTVGGEPFYQYVTYSLAWHADVSNTGRGYRISGLTAESFGGVRRVGSLYTLKTTIRVALVSIGTAETAQAEVHMPPFGKASVSAQCNGNVLMISGARVVAPGSGWLPSANQPFNAVVEIKEEASL